MASLLNMNEETELKNDKELKKHGGQDWKMTNYVEDFSVTTNALSTPLSGINAIKESIVNIDHYPPLDNEPALTDLAAFIWKNEYKKNQNGDRFNKLKSSLILGNGASELVDIMMRVCKENDVKSFRPGPTKIQYKDYERCAKQNKFKILKSNNDSAHLLSMVNPTNPTGDFMNLDVMKKYIEDHAADNSFVIVDESMIFWYGKHWRTQSLSSQYEWINKLHSTRNITLFINFSWTKIWKCCGIRIGSMIAFNEKCRKQIVRKQCPWSVNALGLSFISGASKDEEYMNKTWKITKLWRSKMVQEIEDIFNNNTDGEYDDDNKLNISLYGETFLSWIWCDTHNALLAKLCHENCKNYGVPIRYALHGYNQPSCIRFGVRKPSSTKVLYNALRNAKKEYFNKIKK
eukprot:259349_1